LVIDYGAMVIEPNGAGALAYIKSDSSETDDNGNLFVGAQVLTNVEDTINGIFIDDTNDTVKKFGYFITPKIFSKDVIDAWQKIYVRTKKLLSASDFITVKYRTVEPTYRNLITANGSRFWSEIVWVNTSSFTVTASNVPGLVVGDEVEIIAGDGAGKCAHVSTITGTTTYTVTLDDTFDGVTTNTARACFSDWKKIATLTSQSDEFFEFPIGVQSVWIQFKICMQHTGTNELYDLAVVNKSVQEAK